MSLQHLGKILRVDKGLSAVEEEVWNKAHALYMDARVRMRRTGKRSARAPLGTEWVGNDLVPHDPDNKIGRLCNLRLQRYGKYTIAKELGITELAVTRALKRLQLYVELGMIDAQTCEKVQQISCGFGEPSLRRGKETEAKILLVLGKGPATAGEIAKRIKAKGTTVRLWLLRLKKNRLVDRELGKYGKWYLLGTIKSE